jgi:uncharacterized protein (TIGR00266 family)
MAQRGAGVVANVWRIDIMLQVEILYQPAFALAKVSMSKGDEVRAEAGAMVSMNQYLEIETKAQGGFLKSLSRSVLGGESFFMNTFKATNDGAELTLAPHLPGDIMQMEMQGRDFIVQSGSYLGSDTKVNVDTKWGGAKTFFGGEGLFMLRCSGNGTLIVSSYGAIHKVQLGEGEIYNVDSGHIVAFDAHIPYQVRKVGSWKSTIFGGEGLMVEFTGPGNLYLQSRSPSAFISWLAPLLPDTSNNS